MGLLSVHRKKDEISSALDGIIKGKKGSRDAYERIDPMRQLKAFYSFYVRMAFEGSFSPILKKDSARILIHLLHVSTVSLGLAMAISITPLAHFRRQRVFLIIRFLRINIYARQSIR